MNTNILTKVLVWCGVWDEPDYGVEWECPMCGCQMESQDEPDDLICRLCLSELGRSIK